MGGDGVELAVVCFCCIGNVCCKFCHSFLVDDCGAGNVLDIFLDFVAYAGHVVGAFVPHLRGSDAAVLCVGFEILDKVFEIQFCLVVVILDDDDGLVFPCYHFGFVKTV